MASFNKINVFVEDLTNKTHDLFGTAGSDADTCKVMLTAAATVATNSVKADLTDLSTANGYTAGGASVGNVGTRSTGTMTLTGTNVTWTASGGTIGAFRYVTLYNDTPTSPADPLIAWWDYGSSLTLNDGESFTVKFNNGVSSGTIFTLS